MTPDFYDLSSATGVRAIVAALCLGHNYRLYTEGETRSDLFDAFRSIFEVVSRLPEDAEFGEWQAALQMELADADGEQLQWWLLGLGKKTADNLGVNRGNRAEYLREIAEHVRVVTEGGDGLSPNQALLMLMSGAATLTIRGSRKSTAGKTLERAFLRAILTLLGLEENVDFWLNMERDAEVAREIDVEIATRRGRIRVEMGLIGQGNQEVIEDKIQRVGTRGMVIFDRIGPKSNAWTTAENNQVAFIQIRNNQPLTEVYEHLKDLLNKTLTEPPDDEEGIRAALAALPDELFTIGLLPEG